MGRGKKVDYGHSRNIENQIGIISTDALDQVRELSIERLKAEKRPIWESAARNKANDSSLITIAKHAAQGQTATAATPNVPQMPDKAEKLSLVNNSRRHYGMNE